MVHDGIGVGVPVRVFVGSAGENAYRIVRNGDQHHLDGVHRHYVVSILLAKDKKAWFKENLLMLVSIALPIFRPLRLLRLVAVLNVLNRTGGMGGAWTYHTVHMLQRDTADVYRRPLPNWMWNVGFQALPSPISVKRYGGRS